jgi:hypothetical protein
LVDNKLPPPAAPSPAATDPDPRATYTRIRGDQTLPGGAQIKDGALVLAVGRVRLDDGQIIDYAGPNVATFNLIEARKLQLRANQSRPGIVKRLRLPLSGSSPELMSDVFDFLAGASASVVMSVVAIEGFANALIDNLPLSAQVSVDRDEGPTVLGKDKLVRTLSLTEKLDKVGPLATGKASVKGTAAWGRFVELRRLRDELVHVKRFGYRDEPDDPAAYGRLLKGEGAGAVQAAANIIIAIEPGWIPAPARTELGV